MAALSASLLNPLHGVESNFVKVSTIGSGGNIENPLHGVESSASSSASPQPLAPLESITWS